MRRLLDGLYAASGALAAASVVGIVVLVFGQVVLNLIDYVAGVVAGRSFGLLIPSYASLSGYALAFATFLSLGLGLRRAAHIRVTLLETHLPHPVRRSTLVLVALLGVGVGALLTWSFATLAWQSYQWGDRDTGLLKIPLWIPQSVLCSGVAVFLVAALDTLVDVLRRGDSEALAVQDPTDGVG